MIQKFLNYYIRLVGNVRRLSRLSSFVLASVALLSIGEYTYLVYSYGNSGYLEENYRSLVVAAVFHAALAALFILRFLMLRNEEKQRLWISEILGVLGAGLVYSYIVVTREIYGAPTPYCMDCFYHSTFVFGSPIFTVAFLGYLVLSICKYLILIVGSVFIGIFSRQSR